MYILMVETTGKYGSAAVIDEDGKCISACSTEAMNHLQDIMQLIDFCCKKAGIQPNELTQIGASVGPGSFTGIRIGVSTARAMAQMLKIPCIAVSTLEAMAEKAVVTERKYKYIASIINARRNQIYGALWKVENNKLVEVFQQKQYMIEEFLEKIHENNIAPEKVYIIGDGIDAYQDIITEDGKYLLAQKGKRYQDASSAAKVALRLIQEGKTVSYDKLLPNYMRKSEAEMRLESGTLSKKIGKDRWKTR